MVVAQIFNPRYNDQGGSPREEYLYKIKTVTNFTDVAIGKSLTRDEVDKWIHDGVSVKIQPVD
jgi:hypothetical protein